MNTQIHKILLMDNNVNGNSANSKEKNENSEKNKQLKSLVIFISVVTVLVSCGVYFHLNTDQSNPKTEAFFEARKNPESYHEYKAEEESAKKKAERNIFLQN